MIALAGVVAFELPVVLAPLLAGAATLAASVHPPAVAASTPRLVDAEHLQRANAARAAIGQARDRRRSGARRGLLAVSSPAVAILANAATFLASAVAVATITAGPAFHPLGRRRCLRAAGRAARRRRRPARRAGRRAGHRRRRDLQRGLRDPHRDTGARGRPRRRRPGWLRAAARRVRHRRRGGAAIAGRIDGGHWRRTLAAALALVALPVAALGVVDSLWIAIALAVVGGTGAVVAEVLAETALPRMLDDAVLARAYGIMLPITLSGIVAGSLIAGPLVALLGVTGALLATGAAVLTLAALLLRRPLVVAASLPVPSV